MGFGNAHDNCDVDDNSAGIVQEQVNRAKILAYHRLHPDCGVKNGVLE